MTTKDDEHWNRGVWATRFFDGDANELAALLALSAGREETIAMIKRFRESRDRLLLLAAGCELAACVLKNATTTG